MPTDGVLYNVRFRRDTKAQPETAAVLSASGEADWNTLATTLNTNGVTHAPTEGDDGTGNVLVTNAYVLANGVVS